VQRLDKTGLSLATGGILLTQTQSIPFDFLISLHWIENPKPCTILQEVGLRTNIASSQNSTRYCLANLFVISPTKVFAAYVPDFASCQIYAPMNEKCTSNLPCWENGTVIIVFPFLELIFTQHSAC